MERAETGSAAMTLLRALSETGSRQIGDLAASLKRSRRQISKAAAQLALRGWISRASNGSGIYSITPAGIVALTEGKTVTSGPAGSERKVTTFRDTLRGRAWLAMRARRRFTVGDIVIDASSSTKTDLDRANIARYIKRLSQSGYIAELPRRQRGTAPSSPGYKVFILRKDTGRNPPIYREADNAIFDPNTGENLPCQHR